MRSSVKRLYISRWSENSQGFGGYQIETNRRSALDHARAQARGGCQNRGGGGSSVTRLAEDGSVVDIYEFHAHVEGGYWSIPPSTCA